MQSIETFTEYFAFLSVRPNLGIPLITSHRCLKLCNCNAAVASSMTRCLKQCNIHSYLHIYIYIYMYMQCSIGDVYLCICVFVYLCSIYIPCCAAPDAGANCCKWFISWSTIPPPPDQIWGIILVRSNQTDLSNREIKFSTSLKPWRIYLYFFSSWILLLACS